MSYQWREYQGREELIGALATEMCAGLGRLLADAPRAGLIAAGGTTAPPLLRRIADADLDWARIWVTLSDERWVSPQHDASNEKMVRENLLQGPAGAAHFLPIYLERDTPEAGEAPCHEQLSAMPWDSSLCLLGMGRDGHVASLFPEAEALKDALNPAYDRCCKAVRPVSAEVAGPHPRMTLTLPAMMRTRHIHLLITGADKRAAFERARSGTSEREMPVRAVLRQSRVPVTVNWAP
ncbi:MAG: 6-phosphogluconolactonase [Gammaproteobacteria bacterium]|nr:6-phosphogluconolactonase [Gammaproteobacteria bacterium]